MNKPVITILCLFFFGFGSEHSKITKSTAISSAEGKIKFQFQIAPAENMQLTHQAPWSITLHDVEGLDLPTINGKYTTKEYDKNLPGFTIETKATTLKKGTIKYKMKAFVCTLDKTRCYPQTHKGEIKWSTKS